LTGLILRDAAKIQMQDIERLNRKRARAGKDPLTPLYTADDVQDVLALCNTVEYDSPVTVAPGVTALYVEAGHMLGSASIQLSVDDQGKTRRLVFSGDLGQFDAPILMDPESFRGADVVVMESTYGDRDHKPIDQTISEFESIVGETVTTRGKLLVPTFAVGRAQLLLYLLAIMFRKGKVPKFPLYLDSPMAIEATRIYARHLELFDEEFHQFITTRSLQDDLTTLKTVSTADESRALNDVGGPSLIMAGAGMCNAGRILHHLKYNLWKSHTAVLFIGFQAEGTLGRLLVEGAREVSIFGERIAVKATIHSLGGFSAHAGQSDLVRWFSPMGTSQPRVFLTHGEARGREPLAAKLKERFGVSPELPTLGQSVIL
jgi:metallo-beta-lactamase family protein